MIFKNFLLSWFCQELVNARKILHTYIAGIETPVEGFPRRYTAQFTTFGSILITALLVLTTIQIEVYKFKN